MGDRMWEKGWVSERMCECQGVSVGVRGGGGKCQGVRMWCQRGGVPL